MARIMIVDDAGVVRAILKKHLTHGGHEVVFQATTGAEAISGYLQHKPDVVTMDISMPDMGGITALKKILQIDPNAKVVMVSAIDQKDIVLQAMQAGAMHYMIKPVNETTTIQIIDEVMKRNT